MWPDGKRAAAAFTFDFDAEEVWIGEDPANADRPGALSQGTYGAKVAVPQILALLRRHDLKATFFVPGRVAEQHGDRVREIIADGHEVGHHGYTHTAANPCSSASRQSAVSDASPAPGSSSVWSTARARCSPSPRARTASSCRTRT